MCLSLLAAVIIGGVFWWFNFFHDFDSDERDAAVQAAIPPPSKTFQIMGSVEPAIVVPSIQRLALSLTNPAEYDSDRLMALNPSYLRFAYGDTSTNRNFLDLCLQVGANPWIIISPAIGEADLETFGSYLGHNADTSQFSNVMIELTNEYGGEDHSSQAADQTFSLIKEAAGPHINLIKAEDREYYYPDWSKAVSDVSGLALAQALIDNTYLNRQPQAVVASAQSDKQWTSTGITTAMLNQILGGSLHKINVQLLKNGKPLEDSGMTLAAFRTGDQWSAAIVSMNDRPIEITLQFPDDELSIPSSMNVLLHTQNAKIDLQPLKKEGRTVTFEMPANAMAVMGSG